VIRLEQLVIDAARVDPDCVAIRDRDVAWTYRELDDWSCRLAAHIASMGVGPGDRVAVWAPKSCRVIAALQAILRLGAVYVPIDPLSPASRAARILDDCGVRLTLTTSVLSASLGADRRVFLLDDDQRWSWLASPSGGPPAARAPVTGVGSRPAARLSIEDADDRLAYILYTSGSTGVPKGVCISHRNALAFVDWAVRATGAGAADSNVFANHAPLAFDLSVFDLYGAFLTRSTVCLVPETIAYVGPRLAEFIASHHISVWYSVPSALMLMTEHGGLLDRERPYPAIVIFAGEVFPIDSLRLLRERWPRARMFNFYGPTETNVCTSHDVGDVPADQTSPVPIGAAASGDRVWTVKEDGTAAGVGERGELYVAGPTVMMGYWGRDAQRGPYRTGDVCILRPDGQFDFVGRRDDMIKHRGHRIEPGEIEAALSQHPNVKDVAVLAIGAGPAQQLVAFVVPRRAPGPTLIELKRFSAERVPRYMLVDRVETLNALPRSDNGKIDRLALRQLAPLAPGAAPADARVRS